MLQPNEDADPKPWWQKLLWLIVIWSASVAALAVLAALMRMLMSAAGLTVK